MIKCAVIVSGPTVEPIDPVRYISNHSSGKSGLFLAQEAVKRGIDEIIYITGPTNYIPDDVKVINVGTALEMHSKVMEFLPDADVLIMAAAVADYRPAEVAYRKIKKSEETMTLTLVKNPDILKDAGGRKRDDQVVVGYAAETDDFMKNGRNKMVNKKADMIVLNHISESNPVFGSDHNEIYLLTENNSKEVKRTTKDVIASEIWDEIVRLSKMKKGEA